MLKKPRRIINKRLLADFRVRPCLICGKTPSDPAHIKTKGSGGHDVEENILSLCRSHHSIQHTMSWYKFSEKFPMIKWALKSKGWFFDLSGDLPKLLRKI